MHYRSLDEIRAQAAVAPADMFTREARLQRWAELLEAHGERRVELLSRVEFVPRQRRDRMRRDGSAVALAFADPWLRGAGLAGDTLLEAQQFFELSDEQAHELLCDCHYLAAATGSRVSRRVRALTRPARSPTAWLFGRG